MTVLNILESSRDLQKPDFEPPSGSDIEIYRVIVDRMQQGVLVYNKKEILGANPQLCQMLDYPPALLEPGTSLEEFIDYGAARGDYATSGALTLQSMRMHMAAGKDYVTERLLPNGRTLRIDCCITGSFGVGTYTDVTEARNRERLLQEKEQQVRKLAETDGLTGLANRRSLDRKLHIKCERHAAVPNSESLAVILIDLDRFKSVNDTHGHGMGDALLQQLSQKFTSLICETDVISRIGGDEFAAIVEAPTKLEIEKIAKNLCEAAHGVVEIQGTQLKVGASIGVAILSTDMAGADELLTAADLALYDAKHTKKGSVRLYDPSLGERAINRSLIEQDLQFAIQNDEFILHYQVQRNLETAEDVGYEALVRWQHPERGLVSPAEFVSIAEETGAIVEMGRWALRQATTDIQKLDSKSRVAVNVSPVQFSKSDIVEDVREALAESGLAPSRLEVEITEDIFITDTENTLRALNKLRALGVGIALDDFGKGYSSLSYLNRFPFAKLKIDHAFISNMTEDRQSRTLVNSILSLASSLNLKVTAEGVETQEQWDILKSSKCDEAQGYFLGRPTALNI